MKLVEVFSELETEFDKDVLNILLDQCNVAINSTPIYRGIEQEFNFETPDTFITNPPKGRKSAYTYNFVTLFLDHIHPEWKKFPKRSESWPCTTNINRADEYGKIYRVFPFGNPDIGVTYRHDFWDIIPERGVDVNSVNRKLAQIFNVISDDHPANEKELLRLIKKADQKYSDRNKLVIKEVNELKKYTKLSKKRQKEMTLMDTLLYLLSVERSLVQVKKLSELVPESGEVWFSDRALFIQHKVYARKYVPRIRKYYKEMEQ